MNPTMPRLCRLADRLDFQGIRREVVAVLGCTHPSPDMLGPLLEMAEARQHDAELQPLKVCSLLAPGRRYRF